MQPVEAQKKGPPKSWLLDSLQVYLSNKSRLQPIIGLSSIIECVRTDTHNREALYLCEVCVRRLTKADIRNHIMGSLHRYNYVKARHPHLVSEWAENCDLSKMARPLMEKARALEDTEGPGDVQLLEVEDSIYRRMTSCMDSDAVTLINILRDVQGEQLQRCPIQSDRTVLFCQKRPKWDKTSASLGHFLDGYTGSEPLIGLSRVVECQSEDGSTYCFLCHCCRVRSNKKDTIDHLTSSSHLVNYLMETRPDIGDISEPHELRSLAIKAQQQEGRGELTVINLPESLCILLTSKSYHWCIKMLCNEWTHGNIQQKIVAVKAPRVSKTSNQEKSATEVNVTIKEKMRKASNTVFKVSLPLAEGPLVLKRTSFSLDTLPLSPKCSPTPSDADAMSWPDSQPEDWDLDCNTRPFESEYLPVLPKNFPMCASSPLQSEPSSGEYTGLESNVCDKQEVDDYMSENAYVNQPEYIPDTRDTSFYGKISYNEQYTSQEQSSQGFPQQWPNEGPQTQEGQLPSAVSHTPYWSPYNCYYRHEEAATEPWFSEAWVDVPRDERQLQMTSDSAQYYYQQQPPNQYMAHQASHQTASGGQHGLSGELAYPLGTAWMYPGVGGSNAHSSDVTPQCPPAAQPSWQTYMEFAAGPSYTAPQSYMTQPLAQQLRQLGHWIVSSPSYNTGPTATNQDQCFSYPYVS